MISVSSFRKTRCAFRPRHAQRFWAAPGSDQIATGHVCSAKPCPHVPPPRRGRLPIAQSPIPAGGPKRTAGRDGLSFHPFRGGPPLHDRLVPLGTNRSSRPCASRDSLRDLVIRAGSSPLTRFTTPACPPVSDVRNVPAWSRRGKARRGICGQEGGQKISTRYPRGGVQEGWKIKREISPLSL